MASNLSSEKFLKELGAKNISFLGNIKFIQEIDETTINSINSKMLKNKDFGLLQVLTMGKRFLFKSS